MLSPSYSRRALDGFGRTTIHSLVHPGCHSLLRANLLVLVSLAVAFRLSRFPENHATLWLLAPLVAALAGSADAIRCMGRRWNLYHGSVILSLYMHLMALMLMLFFLLWPYTHWLEAAS